MFSKLLEYLRKALKEMVDSPSNDVISNQDIDTISSCMQDAIDKWKGRHMCELYCFAFSPSYLRIALPS